MNKELGQEGGLKSQIEGTGKERMGRGGWREEGVLKSQIEITGEEWMWREAGAGRGD